MRRLAYAALVVAFAALAGCAAQNQLVAPATQTVANALAVTPTHPWNRVATPEWEGRIEVWSFDGPALEAVLFVAGVADGEPVFRLKAATDSGIAAQAPPPFRLDMTSIEIAELLRATLIRSFRTPLVTVRDVKPAPFAGAPGFRFETTLVGRDEVERKGTAAGAVRNGRLYLIWYQGARIHYYERYLREFDRIVASARFVD